MEMRETKRIRITQLPRPTTEADLDRRQGTLVGVVEKKSISAISVSLGENSGSYGLEFPKDIDEFIIGSKYRFSVTITTYAAKDGIIRTKFRITEAKLVEDDTLKSAFIPVYLPVNILSATRCDNPRTFLLTMQRMVGEDVKEIYHARGYNSENRDNPPMGKGWVKFTTQKSKYLIKDSGETYQETESRNVMQDGVEVKVESLVYIPCLTIQDMTSNIIADLEE